MLLYNGKLRFSAGLGCLQTALANGVSNISFGDLSGDLGRTMYQYNFQIPAYYTLLVRPRQSFICHVLIFGRICFF